MPKGPRVDARATITFDGKIVGLMGDPYLINKTQDLFSPTNYILSKAGTLEGLNWPETETRDYIKITGSHQNVLELRWTTTSASPWNLETLRVLTVATPAISTAVPESSIRLQFLCSPSMRSRFPGFKF